MTFPTPPWRVGRKLGRTLYIGDDLVGMMDSPQLADFVVTAVNEAARMTFVNETHAEALRQVLSRAETAERDLAAVKTQLDRWEADGRNVVRVSHVRALVVHAQPPHVDVETGDKL